MSRIQNPFSAYIVKPKELAPTGLIEQFKEALTSGNVERAHALARRLGIKFPA